MGRRGGGGRRFLTGLVVGILMVLAGCSQRGEPEVLPDQAPPTTTSRAASPATATPAGSRTSPRTAVLAAYRANWDDIVAVGRTADPSSPRLAAHATGEALQALRLYFQRLQKAGQVVRGTVAIKPKVVALGATSAALDDCADTTRLLAYDAKTGALRDTPGQPIGQRVVLTLEDGRWKVAKVTANPDACGG